MRAESGVVHNFRLNFRDALDCDGRSLSAFARDCATSVSYLSRIRSGSSFTHTGMPIVPGLDTCERIANGLGYSLIDMIRPASEFRKLLKEKQPGWVPPRPVPNIGRPVEQQAEIKRQERKQKKLRKRKKKTPAA